MYFWMKIKKSIYVNIYYKIYKTQIREKHHSFESALRGSSVMSLSQNWENYGKAKVKQSLYRPWQAQKFPGGGVSQISRHSAHEGGKDVNLAHRLPLHPRKFFWYSFLLEAESTPRP